MLATPAHLHAEMGQAGARSGQASDGREAAGTARCRSVDAGRTGARKKSAPDGRARLRVQPGGDRPARSGAARRTGARALSVLGAAEPRHCPRRPERDVESRAARLQHHQLCAGQNAGKRWRRAAFGCSVASWKMWPSSRWNTPAAKSRTSTSVGLIRAKCGGMTVVGESKMAIYDDVSDERLKIYDKGVMPDSLPERLRRVQADHARRRHPDPQDRHDRAAARGMRPFCRVHSHRQDADQRRDGRLSRRADARSGAAVDGQ